LKTPALLAEKTWAGTEWKYANLERMVSEMSRMRLQIEKLEKQVLNPPRKKN
jgi:hypothetical protein